MPPSSLLHVSCSDIPVEEHISPSFLPHLGLDSHGNISLYALLRQRAHAPLYELGDDSGRFSSRRDGSNRHASLTSVTSSSRPSIRIPDTICFYMSSETQWFFYSPREKRVLRKNRWNVQAENIFEEFCQVRKPRLNREAHNIVATLYIDGRDSNGHPQITIEYLDRDGLHDLLFKRPRDFNGILQKFVPPSACQNNMIRAVWNSSICMIERRVNIHKIYDSKYSITDRCVTFEGCLEHSIFEPVLSNAVVDTIETACQSVVCHVESILECRLREVVFHFKQDENENMHLLWISGVRKKVEINPPLSSLDSGGQISKLHALVPSLDISSRRDQHTSSSFSAPISTRTSDSLVNSTPRTISSERSTMSFSSNLSPEEQRRIRIAEKFRSECPQCGTISSHRLLHRVTHAEVLRFHERYIHYLRDHTASRTEAVREAGGKIPPAFRRLYSTMNVEEFCTLYKDKKFLDSVIFICDECWQNFENESTIKRRNEMQLAVQEVVARRMMEPVDIFKPFQRVMRTSSDEIRRNPSITNTIVASPKDSQSPQRIELPAHLRLYQLARSQQEQHPKYVSTEVLLRKAEQFRDPVLVHGEAKDENELPSDAAPSSARSVSDQRRADALRSRPVHVGNRKKDEHLENPNGAGLLQSRNGDEKLRLPRVALLSPRKSKGSNDNQQEKPDDGKRSSQGHGEMLLRASLRKRVAHAAEIYEEAEHKMRVASHLEAPDSSRLGSDIQSRDLTEHVVLPVAKSVPVPPPLSARSRRRIHRKMVEREILKRKQHESRAAQDAVDSETKENLLSLLQADPLLMNGEDILRLDIHDSGAIHNMLVSKGLYSSPSPRHDSKDEEATAEQDRFDSRGGNSVLQSISSASLRLDLSKLDPSREEEQVYTPFGSDRTDDSGGKVNLSTLVYDRGLSREQLRDVIVGEMLRDFSL